MKNTATILALGVLGLLALALLIGEAGGYVAAMLLSLLAMMVSVVFDKSRARPG